MKTISIEQLAEKLNGKLWVKGDIKRIYLDRGYNTKKMSTKTYVFQREDGSFGVSCYIDCPSQAWQWIKSQQDEIIESVESDMEDAMATEVFLIVNEAGNPVDDSNNQVAVNSLYSSDYYLHEATANKALKNFPSGFAIKMMNREEFNAEVERLDELDRPERERKLAEDQAKRQAEEADKMAKKAEEVKELKKSGAIPANAQKVKHAKFGFGTVISANERIIDVLFDDASIGLKKLLTGYVKLEIVA